MVSEEPISLPTNTYFFIYINNYGNIYSSSKEGESIDTINCLGKLTNYRYDNNFLTKEHIFRCPENIFNFEIKIYDSRMNIINLFNINYSLTLEVSYYQCQ